MDVKNKLQKAQIRAEKWHALNTEAILRAGMFLELEQDRAFKRYLQLAKYTHVRTMKQIKAYQDCRKQDKYYTIIGTVFCALVVAGMGVIIYKTIKS